jgi:hypothetical protein
MVLDTRNKIMYGLGVGISKKVFFLFLDIQQFPISGSEVDPRGLTKCITYTACNTRNNNVYGFTGGVLNNFRDIQQFPVSGG